ncbi:ATP-binding protein [Acinetobacter baumannii]|uniref:AAA family ATPase n=1 Tax=Acinetobacter baumannii TaxID=470 RepID=UPI0023417FBB|nr:AAA family ATPase [Acinetobacter baumannii]MDC4990712.1 ATP-binding protein [Acinetobacter baumannii]MDR9544571.1 AAA family ATPase [Acinetobacter baumannii]
MYKIFVVNKRDLYEKIKEESFILISPNEKKDGALFCEIEVFEGFQSVVKVYGLICFYHRGERLDLFQFLNHQGDKLVSLFLGSYGLFTILENIEEYDKIRDLQNFKNILSAIKDVSYLNFYERSERRDFYKFKNTSFFINEFLASKERLKAYGNGFSGINKSRILEDMYVEIGNGVKISFKRSKNNNSIFPNSIYSLVGKNGLGKSIALKEFYKKYINNFNKIQVFSSGIISQSYFQGLAKNDDSYINVSKNSNFNYLISELLLFRGENLSSMLFFLLADIFSDERYHNVFISRLPFNEKLSLKNFFEDLGKGRFFDETVFSKMSLTRVIKGKKYSLSSGEKVILNVILNMSLAILKSGGENLFIFDEPENHLHPNFISQLMNFINKILYPSNSYAIMATHSPFIVKNLLKENIVVLKQKNDQVIAEKITFNTLGANVETISQFVFGNNDLMELEQEVAKKFIDAYNDDRDDEDKIIRKLSNDLSPELILEILRKLKY